MESLIWCRFYPSNIKLDTTCTESKTLIILSTGYRLQPRPDHTPYHATHEALNTVVYFPSYLDQNLDLNAKSVQSDIVILHQRRSTRLLLNIAQPNSGKCKLLGHHPASVNRLSLIIRTQSKDSRP